MTVAVMDNAMKSDLYLNKDLGEPKVHDLATGTAVVYSTRSPDRGEDPNEDSAGVYHVNGDSGVLAVADGVGGRRNGAPASSTAIKTIRTCLKDALDRERKMRVGIMNAFEQANNKITDIGSGAATTLAVVEFDHNLVRPYHVGDSTILVVGQRGKIKMQIVAHSPVGYAVESGLLDETQAMYHEDRHLVSNILGTPDMHIHVGSSLELARRDTVIVGSDGVSDNLHTEEIVECIRKGPLDVAARTLVERISKRMTTPSEGRPSKPDDLTFIIYRRNS
jgi:serine/threonine protein phosphatase PrpC